jgi:L-cystine uptake protein TcyP (sodium:dicarboxylate symporter family)
MSQSPEPSTPFGLRWQDHLGLITTVVLTAATVMNIAAVGGWNTQTSLALLRSMGGVSVLTASLISLSPNILSGITSAVCAYVLYRRITERSNFTRFRMGFLLRFCF